MPQWPGTCCCAQPSIPESDPKTQESLLEKETVIVRQPSKQRLLPSHQDTTHTKEEEENKMKEKQSRPSRVQTTSSASTTQPNNRFHPYRENQDQSHFQRQKNASKSSDSVNRNSKETTFGAEAEEKPEEKQKDGTTETVEPMEVDSSINKDEELKDLKEKLSVAKKECQKAQDTITDLKKKLSAAERSQQKAEDSVTKLAKDLSAAEQKYKEAQDTIANLNEQHKEEINHVRNQALIEGNETCKKHYDSIIQRYTQENETLRAENVKLRAQKADLSDRLSSMASHRMRDDNPCVEDLSDAARHSVVVSKWQTLMHGEYWTVYEALQTVLLRDDEKISMFLLSVMKLAHDKFQDTLTAFNAVNWENLISSGTLESGGLYKSVELTKHLSDDEFNTMINSVMRSIPEFFNLPKNEMHRLLNAGIRSSLKQIPIPEIELQDFHEHLKISLSEKFPEIPWEKCSKFADELLNICYLMILQSPPMVLVFDETKDKDADDHLYEPDGDKTKPKPWYIKYVLFPPMLRHKDGPVLCKGSVELK